MPQILNQLAKIELDNEVLQSIDIGGIYKDFNQKYKRLDDLKNFRADYEKRNALMRWWHNDKLKDAQINSIEVQAEFSKTIGQLMLLSVMQSKALSEQQTQLNEQQGKLKSQADGIVEHASELQKQHRILADQSEKLETLVHEYFELKGLTEDGAQKLINIAQEVKATKVGMLQEFTVRSKKLEVLCGEVATQMELVLSQANEQFRLGSEQTQSSIQALQKEIRHEMDAFTSKFTVQSAGYQEKFRLIEDGLDAQNTRVSEVDAALLSQKAIMAIWAQQQKIYQAKQVLFEKKILHRWNSFSLVFACSLVIILVILFLSRIS